MVTSEAQTVDEYIAALPANRRGAVEAVRDVVRENLPDGYREGMQFGMIGWYVPLDRFPNTYNGQPLGLAALAGQKNHISLYLTPCTGTRKRSVGSASATRPRERSWTWASLACG